MLPPSTPDHRERDFAVCNQRKSWSLCCPHQPLTTGNGPFAVCNQRTSWSLCCPHQPLTTGNGSFAVCNQRTSWSLCCPHQPLTTGNGSFAVCNQRTSWSLCCPRQSHTPSLAFWHLPPNSAITGYATEGALLVSAHLSTDAVSALRKV